MSSQRTFRVLIVAALIGGASLAVGGLLAGSVPASSASVATPAMLVQWTWTGNGGTDGFVNDCNWQPPGICTDAGFPDGTDDDPTIPVVSGEWGIILFDFSYLSTLTIGDMTILDGVDFDSDHHPHEMTAETLTIDADDDDITVTFTGTLEFTAN